MSGPGASRTARSASASGGLSWLRIKAVAKRHSYVLQREPQRLVRRADLAGGRRRAVRVDRRVLRPARRRRGRAAWRYLLAGILLFHVVFQAEIGVATGFMEETWSRNLLNLLVTPLREVEYVLGIVLVRLGEAGAGRRRRRRWSPWGCSRSTSTDIGFALVPIIAVLLLVGWSCGMIVIGLILRFGQGAEILAWGMLALVLPLSGVVLSR